MFNNNDWRLPTMIHFTISMKAPETIYYVASTITSTITAEIINFCTANSVFQKAWESKQGTAHNEANSDSQNSVKRILVVCLYIINAQFYRTIWFIWNSNHDVFQRVILSNYFDSIELLVSQVITCWMDWAARPFALTVAYCVGVSQVWLYV